MFSTVVTVVAAVCWVVLTTLCVVLVTWLVADVVVPAAPVTSSAQVAAGPAVEGHFRSNGAETAVVGVVWRGARASTRKAEVSGWVGRRDPGLR